MEVQGSVIVGDASEHGEEINYDAFADVGKPRSEEQRDTVPRILVRNFKRQTKLYALFRFFDQFGAITYITMRDQQAVIEFYSTETMDEVLRCKHLALNGAKLRVYQLTWFPHTERGAMEFGLSRELLAACEAASDESDAPAQAWVRALVEACTRDAAKYSEAVTRVQMRLQQVLTRCFPRCRVHVFGSRSTGLALPGADLDLFVDIGDLYNGEIAQDGDAQRELVTDACKELVRHDDFRCTERVLGARVPILRFCHMPPPPALKLHADAAFRNGLGVENSRLLRFLLRLDDRLRPLILLLKQWARWQGLQQQALSRGPAFTSYAIAMLAVFFLQQPPDPVLPPLTTFIRAYTGPKKCIAGWTCGFAEDTSLAGQTCKTSATEGGAIGEAPDPVRGTLALAKRLFAYYRHFNFEEHALLPLIGHTMPKRALEDALAGRGDNTELIDLYKDYTNIVNEDSFAEKLHTRASIVLQDPFELCHNLTRNVKDEFLMKFVSSCALTHEWLLSLQ